MREYVCRILGSEYDVISARDGQEALEMVRRSRPDLLITDMMMPGLGGLDVLRAVRDGETSLPVIFLSARAAMKCVLKVFGPALTTIS